MDIAEFITARLDEEQQLAEAAAEESSPRFDVDGKHWRNSDAEGIYCEELPLAVGPYGVLGGAFVSHVVAHDPARVLREVEAKRRIVEDYLIVVANNAIERHKDNEQRDEAMEAARALIAKSLLMVLRRLAAPYVDHPDYDPTWSLT